MASIKKYLFNYAVSSANIQNKDVQLCTNTLRIRFTDDYDARLVSAIIKGIIDYGYTIYPIRRRAANRIKNEDRHQSSDISLTINSSCVDFTVDAHYLYSISNNNHIEDIIDHVTALLIKR